SMLVSSADKTLYVYRNGVEIGRAGMPNSQAVSPLNDRVFSALNGLDEQGHLRWVEVTAAGKETSSQSLFLAAQKSRLPTEFLYFRRERNLSRSQITVRRVGSVDAHSASAVRSAARTYWTKVL